MSLKIICDKCGKEIKALSTKPDKEKDTGVGFKNQHLCAVCVEEILTKNENNKDQ